MVHPEGESSMTVSGLGCEKLSRWTTMPDNNIMDNSTNNRIDQVWSLHSCTGYKKGRVVVVTTSRPENQLLYGFMGLESYTSIGDSQLWAKQNTIM